MDFTEYQYRQPSRVIQSDEETRRAYCKNTYVLMWSNVSDRFGIFRCEPLKDNVGVNKRHIMRVLKAAYKDVAFKSFDDAIKFCRAVGIKIGFYNKNDEFSYLAGG